MDLPYGLKVESTIPLRNDIEVIKETLLNFPTYLKKHPSKYYKEIIIHEKYEGTKTKFTVVYKDGWPVKEAEVIVIHDICEIEKCCEKILGTELCVRVKPPCGIFGNWIHIKAVASGGPGTVIQLTYEFKAEKGKPIDPCFLQFDLMTILSWDDFSIWKKRKCPGCGCKNAYEYQSIDTGADANAVGAAPATNAPANCCCSCS